MFDPIFTALAWLLSAFYSLVPNYAIAIALLTIAVMLVLFPLNAKAVRSQTAMTKLQPELKRIQAKYKDDPQEQNAQVMALFKEHGASPVGCLLPMLIQGPILYIMFNILRGMTHRGEDRLFDPKYLDHGSRLYQDLHGARKMTSFGIDLSQAASQVVEKSFVTAVPFLLLVAGVVGLSFYSQWMISRRNPQQGAVDNPMAKQMQMMTRIFPIMFGFIGFTSPAGLNVYFLMSSAFRIGQQWLIYKMHPELLPGTGSLPVSSKDVTAKSKDVAPKPASTNGSGDGKPSTGRVTPSGQGRQRSKKKKKR